MVIYVVFSLIVLGIAGVLAFTPETKPVRKGRKTIKKKK